MTKIQLEVYGTARKGYLILRLSRKNNKNKRKILLKVEKTDKLIKDYLEVYKRFRGF